jgi:hypothetical protein
MPVVVVGGHSRNIGKTSVVAGLIGALPEYAWTAIKITQYGHGFCSADGEPCDCQTDDHTLAVTVERASSADPATLPDSARYLAAGACRSLWVRTRQGMLAEAMPRVRKELSAARYSIVESNSVMQFLAPDLYLSVLDAGTADFKDTARLYLDRADAVIVIARRLTPQWRGVSLTTLKATPRFEVEPPRYLSSALIDFVRERISVVKT